jgi:putative PIN family toxin of toxin-antitoxin system
MAPPRIVLDTNVVVSAHLNPDGFEHLVLRLTLASLLRLCLSKEILTEYDAVLRREKFGIDPAMVAESLKLIRKAGVLVRPKRRLSVSSDPEDNRFLECAATAHADYLVTGNKRHFPKAWGKTAVVNAKELVGIVALEFKR